MAGAGASGLGIRRSIGRKPLAAQSNLEDYMRAILCRRYGPPDVLRLEELPRPTPGDNEVLVRIHAASVNAADLDMLSGKFMVRFGAPLKPQHPILGSDIAGRIEAVGSGAAEFRPGDEVFGDLTEWGFGAFAEYVAVPEDALVAKPTSLSFLEAAAVPTAGAVALLNLHGKKAIRPGQRVLVNGAGGGMGTFAVQIAKSFGAEVTGVDIGSKLDMVRSIGADHLIDYTRSDFTRSDERYDLVLDVAAHHSIFECKHVLAPGGIYRFVGGSVGAALQAVFLGPWISRFGDTTMGILMAYPKKKELARMKALLDAGKVSPVIDRSFPLAEVSDALRYLAEGKVRGKVVVAVERHGTI